MIDNIKGSFITNNPDYIKNKICNYNCIKNAYGKVYYVNNPTAEKMLFKYDPETNLVTFKNSIQKFYKNNNHTDFNKNEIKLSVRQLCDHLKIKDDTIVKILEIEIGVNIEVGDISKVLKQLHSHKNQPFRWTSKSKKRLDDWGKKVIHTDYEIKLYDKKLQESLTHKLKVVKHPFDKPLQEHNEGFYLKSQRDLLRYEMHFKRVESYLPSIINLQSLYTDQCLLEIKKRLINSLSQINFKRWYNVASLSLREAQILFCYENEDFFEQFILNAKPPKRKSHKRSYENIKSKIENTNDLKLNLINLMEKKIDELIT